MNSTKTAVATMTNPAVETTDEFVSPLQKMLAEVFGAEVLQLEEVSIRILSDEDVRYIRSSRGRNTWKQFREELVLARTHEISHYKQLEAVRSEINTHTFKGLNLSISVSKAKASCWTHIINSNRTGAMTSFERLKDKYGIMMEQQLEAGQENKGVLNIIDVEHQDQRTSRDYCGDKDTENARQLGKNIMDCIHHIENSMKIFCS